jgi:hypothetical protein
MTTPRTLLNVIAEQAYAAAQTSRDLIMAWAVDRDTSEPRYILQLDADHRGAKCNCNCPNCHLPLLAVNAAKTEFLVRPHFRHPDGAEKEGCILIAARRALDAVLLAQGQFVLPRIRRSKDVEGLSGAFYNAWVERPPERICLAECEFVDEATAFLTVDDGRRLLVRLVGRGGRADEDDGDVAVARIDLEVDDPAIAGMTPEEIFSRLELAWTSACWRRHWSETELDRQAEELARQAAVDALDWLDDDANLPEGLSPAERRETLLHREVKAILEREMRIRLPGLHIEVERRYADGTLSKRTSSTPDEEISLSAVHLEVQLGVAVPDIIIEWAGDDRHSGTGIVEVTVTNPITEERIDRLSSFGFPVLEIDIGRMGGIVSREELSRLVVDEIAGKRWLYHPDYREEEQRLIADIAQEEARRENIKRHHEALLSISAEEWGRRYIDAFIHRWLIECDNATDLDACREPRAQAQQLINDAIEGLSEHGYPEVAEIDRFPLRMIVSRLLSIRVGVGIGYRYHDAWGVINAILCDFKPKSYRWHTLYLMALRIYAPPLNDAQLKRIDLWRDEVKASIQSGADLYVRDATYDRLLALLFPEMAKSLSRPFGTMQALPPPMAPLAANAEPQNYRHSADAEPQDPYLRGQALDAWAKRYPEAAAAWFNSPAAKHMKSR